MTRYVLSEDGSLCAPNDATEDADLLIDWDEFDAMRQRAETAERERDAMQRVLLRHVAFRAAVADLIRDMRLAINQGTPLIKSQVNARADAWLKEFDGPRPVFAAALAPKEPT
jgi:hypothetical protein